MKQRDETPSKELADNVRKYRRRAEMSQEELAHTAGVSPGIARKVEQGGTVRMEPPHTLARALGATSGPLHTPDELTRWIAEHCAATGHQDFEQTVRAILRAEPAAWQ